MRVLIIEDEKPAARHLSGLLQGIRPQAKVLDLVDSVEGAVKWLRTFAAPDLIFMDIQLADGLSFEIFQEVPVEAPVVFTTAYDQYTLKAFKVNSVDYLLKPIDPDELRQSIEKYEKWRNPIDPAAMSALLKGL
ncbi:MAG: response regulator, partial [Saprospiraceae bacterium]|nr:response regulator [Saprospiraceae bacterium]